MTNAPRNPAALPTRLPGWLSATADMRIDQMNKEIPSHGRHQLIARARMDAIISNVSGYGDRMWEQLDPLDRETSLAIARAVLDPKVRDFVPYDAHVLFRRLAPASHPQQVKLSELPAEAQIAEEEGVRAAVDTALGLRPDDPRLLRMRRCFSINVVCTALRQAIDGEASTGVSDFDLWANRPERCFTMFTLVAHDRGISPEEARGLIGRLMANSVTEAVGRHEAALVH